MKDMEETLRLLRSVDTAHGMPAAEAALRLEAAMSLIRKIRRENALKARGESC